MEQIVNVWDYEPGIEAAARFIHGIWGRQENFNFYLDAISHATNSATPALPRFYLLLHENAMIGCSALLTNDLVSRQDLMPWLACLYVAPEFRGRALGARLLAHGIEEARLLGFRSVYLFTDHAGYYEKYGWQRRDDGYNLFGERSRIYCHPVLQ